VGAQTDISTDLPLLLSPRTIHTVWNDPEYLWNGLAFSLPLLLILLSHELGHYLTCRHYRLRSNPPYFLPAPFALGTLGAFIRIRSPIRDKRQLFDVGVSGPIAGFVVLLPFLVYGLANSEVSILIEAEPALATALLYRPGQSLVMQALSALFHGQIGAGEILTLHPVALAAWVGLLATSLNLLPLGQLDGGHILYAAVGRLQRRLALPLWIGLVVCGFIWPGWWIWCLVILILGLRHPPVIDESIRLDRKRLGLAVLAALLFVATFMPVPISVLLVLG
jgi:membrane-associated protease RseP (regulator of RpoE activity)